MSKRRTTEQSTANKNSSDTQDFAALVLPLPCELQESMTCRNIYEASSNEWGTTYKCRKCEFSRRIH